MKFRTKRTVQLKNKTILENSRSGIKNFITTYEIQATMTLVLIAVVLLFIVTAPSVFLKFDTYVSILTVNPFIIILAVSVIPVIIAGEIDLSFPSIMGFGALVFSKVYLATMNPVLAFFAALFSGGVLGLINGILVSRLRVPSLVLTLGTFFLWRGVINVITEGLGDSLVTLRGHLFHQLFVGKALYIPVQTFWAILFASLLWFIINRTRLGAHIYAIGDNRATAQVMGVKVERTLIWVFTISGIGSAFVGVLSDLLQVTFWPTTGEGYLLPVLAAVFIGGTPTWGGKGTIYGTVAGSLVLGLINTGIIAAGATGFWTQVVYGLMIVIAISLHNILRRREAITRRLMV